MAEIGKERIASKKEWFGGAIFLGALIGGWAVLCNSASSYPVIIAASTFITNVVMFLLGFLPVFGFFFMIWGLAKKTGRKGVPIK